MMWAHYGERHKGMVMGFDTNRGIKWACGPHGVSFCALSEALQYDSLFDSRDAAISAAAVEL